MHQRSVVVLALFVLLVALCNAAWAGPVSGKLTPQELERVMRGETVLKKEVDEDSKAGAGLAYGVFHCRRATFWEVVYDYPHYGELFPPITKARVIKGKITDPRFLTEIEMKFSIATVTYTTYNKPSEDGLRLEFGLEDDYPHKYIRDIEGYWQLEQLDENSFLAEYKAEVELDIGNTLRTLIMPIYNALTGRDLPKMMETYRREVAKREG